MKVKNEVFLLGRFQVCFLTIRLPTSGHPFDASVFQNMFKAVIRVTNVKNKYDYIRNFIITHLCATVPHIMILLLSD